MSDYSLYATQLDYYKEELLTNWERDTDFLKRIDSFILYKVITYFKDDPKGCNLIQRDFNTILVKCIRDYNLMDLFSILHIRDSGIGVEECNEIIKETITNVFSPKTLIFLIKLNHYALENKIRDRVEIFNYIFEQLQSMDSERSSILLFNMSLFPDFKDELKNRYPIVNTLIEAYQTFNPNIMVDGLFKGSTIIGKLIQGQNQYIAENYVKRLLNSSYVINKDVKMIGGGGSSLVFKIGSHVLKLGETRHCRKIYVNHRILASQVRKLHTDEQNNPLFYAEIMKYVNTKGITKEDLEELKKDLYDQGLIWDDAKIENCGTLDPDDENISFLPVDYIEVAGEVKDDLRRANFNRREKRVVVIDNDNMTRNYLKTIG